jgi:beta-lactamase class A
MRLIALLTLAPALAAMAEPAPVSLLAQQLELLSRLNDGVTGVSAIHIETGRSVSLRGSNPFPMASAFKVPVGVQIMTLVDEGKLTLDEMVTLGPSDLHPGSGALSELMFHPGVSLSIENLMELMLVISDNTAADVMLREAGGPAAVTARMRALGLPGIRVDRSTALLISDWSGARRLPPETEWNRDMWDRLYDAVPEREHMRARRAEWADPRDTATPDDMAKLLAHIWKKDLFQPAHAGELLDIMERCQTGKSRIKGMLPEGTDVAHKTGSLGGVVNDVGVITLPNGLGHVAIAVFVKGFTKKEEEAARTIAEISRTIYDYFVLEGTTQP